MEGFLLEVRNSFGISSSRKNSQQEKTEERIDFLGRKEWIRSNNMAYSEKPSLKDLIVFGTAWFQYARISNYSLKAHHLHHNDPLASK